MTIENARQTLPGRDFALLIMVEDELTVVRASGLEPEVQRRLEAWGRASETVLAEPQATEDLRTQPLLFKGRSLGVLMAVASADRPLTDDDGALLSEFADRGAVALANAHLFQSLLESATRDSLTGLPNRRELERLLARELERSSRYGEIFSLALIDLDEFKALNDTKGHAAGDALLRQAAATIREVGRASDVAARLGGDEFALLLPETNQFEAAALCERLRTKLEALAGVSLSWGVAEYPMHGANASRLLRTADAAMYASKPRLVGGERAR